MHERTKTYSEFLVASNLTLRKFTGEVTPPQESQVCHTIRSLIPNVLNNILDFFFADHIVLFLWKYKDTKMSRSD